MIKRAPTAYELKRKLVQLGIRQNQMAVDLNIEPAQLNRILTGFRMPTDEQLEAIETYYRRIEVASRSSEEGVEVIEIKFQGEPYLLWAVWAEDARGPGWRNSLYWALISPIGGMNHGLIEKVSIQPEDQGPELRALHAISAVVSRNTLEAAAQVFERWDTEMSNR